MASRYGIRLIFRGWGFFVVVKKIKFVGKSFKGRREVIIKKLIGQTATYGVATIVARFIGFALTPYLTLKLSGAEYGVYSYYFGLIPFGLVILTAGMENGFFRFLSKCDTAEDRKKLYATVLSAVTVAGLSFFILVSAFSPLIFKHLNAYEAGHPSLIPIVAGIIALDAVLAMPYARLRAESNTRLFVTTKIANVLVNVGFCLFFYSVLPHFRDSAGLGWMWIDGYGAGYALLANLLASMFNFVLLSPMLRHVEWGIDKTLLKRIFVFSLPLFLGGFGGTINEFIDRQLLVYLLPPGIGMEQVGIYSGVMKIAALMTLFLQMYRYAAEPFFLSEVKKEDFKKANAEGLKYFTIASMTVFLVIVFYMDIFQFLVSGEEYREALFIVPVMLLSNMLVGIYFNMSFWFKVTERTYFAILITFTGVVFTLLLNILLIPSMGYVGAAYARLGCETAMVLLCYFLNRKYYPVPYDLKTIGLYALVAAALYGVSVGVHIPAVVPRLLFNTLLLGAFLAFFVRREKIDLHSILKK